MNNRITIVIESDIHRKLRNMQAKVIKDTGNNCSFSRIVNDELRTHLKLG